MKRMMVVAAVFGLVGCGPVTRGEARDMTAQKACDWYQSCNEIGAGLTYEDRDECLLEIENAFNNLWDNAACDEIERESLDVCLNAIENTQCGNALDFLNTVFNRCSVDTVCGG